MKVPVKKIQSFFMFYIVEFVVYQMKYEFRLANYYMHSDKK